MNHEHGVVQARSVLRHAVRGLCRVPCTHPKQARVRRRAVTRPCGDWLPLGSAGPDTRLVVVVVVVVRLLLRLVGKAAQPDEVAPQPETRI